MKFPNMLNELSCGGDRRKYVRPFVNRELYMKRYNSTHL